MGTVPSHGNSSGTNHSDSSCYDILGKTRLARMEKIDYMVITYCLLVLGYTCNIPYGTLCGAMTGILMNVQNKYIPFGCSDECNWCDKILSQFHRSENSAVLNCKDRISDGCGHIWMYFYSLSFLLLAKTRQCLLRKKKKFL